MRVLLLFVPLLLVSCAPPPAAAQTTFELPIACAVGSDCIVQNYVDLDPAAGAAEDPMCGPLSYDGHDGIDIRAPAAMAARGVAVLAPAAGVVRFVRDGEEDGAFLRGGMAAIADRECGNGLRIDHEGGWSTQLCHMRRGSVRVAAGNNVSVGQELGLVGLSGHTQFPHVHMALRQGEVEYDPLTGRTLDTVGACGNAEAATPGTHWSDAARTALSYRSTQWFQAGFTGTAPAEGVDAESFPADAARTSPVLVFWALATAPRDTDVLRIRLYGPGDVLIGESTRTQPRDQAQAWLFTGQRAPAGGWPAGTYRGEATLLRGGRVVTTRSDMLMLR